MACVPGTALASSPFLTVSFAPLLLSSSPEGGVLPYLALFVLVVAGGAGVPMVGTAAVTAAAALASQNVLSIDDVIAVACAAAVIGGLLGYGGGRRWGVQMMERPGRYEQRRRVALEKGHDLYGRWGWLACFVIPSFMAGIARMAFVMFIVFNTIAAVCYQFATALPVYGAAKVVSGHSDAVSIVELIAGVAALVLIGLRLLGRRRAHPSLTALDGGAGDGPHPAGSTAAASSVDAAAERAKVLERFRLDEPPGDRDDEPAGAHDEEPTHGRT